jgi:hypothetical protein
MNLKEVSNERGVPIYWDSDIKKYFTFSRYFNTLDQARGFLFKHYFGYE